MIRIKINDLLYLFHTNKTEAKWLKWTQISDTDFEIFDPNNYFGTNCEYNPCSSSQFQNSTTYKCSCSSNFK